MESVLSGGSLKRLSLRFVLPILAAVFFGLLSFAGIYQTHVTDGPSYISSDLGQEPPEDIGPPADAFLLAVDLPAVIALFPLLPLTYWVSSDIVLRTAWGLSSVVQWFLIGRYFDRYRGLLPPRLPGHRIWLNKALFLAGLAGGTLFAELGLIVEASGDGNVWGMVRGSGLVFWGIAFVVIAVRWRSSSPPFAFGKSNHIEGLNLH